MRVRIKTREEMLASGWNYNASMAGLQHPDCDPFFSQGMHKYFGQVVILDGRSRLDEQWTISKQMYVRITRVRPLP